MDSEQRLREQVQEAAANKRPLAICGGRSKSFYGREEVGAPLSVCEHAGIVNYDPSELVMTAKAGTPLKEILARLDQENQMLGFEPPLFADSATLGGTVAAGLAGPRRPFSGAVRDFVLGVKLLTGQGEIMRFGGQVIKNVAGFDVSRLMVGAMGSLGVILEVSLKVLPKPSQQVTIKLSQADVNAAIRQMNEMCAKPYPVSAMAWCDGALRVRLSGTETGISDAVDQIGGEVETDGARYWVALREHQLAFFDHERLLVRVSVAPSTPLFSSGRHCAGQVIDWAGAVRWFCMDTVDEELLHWSTQQGGHATLFKNADRCQEVFQSLPSALMQLHQNLKNRFDPSRILNPGRLYTVL